MGVGYKSSSCYSFRGTRENTRIVILSFFFYKTHVYTQIKNIVEVREPALRYLPFFGTKSLKSSHYCTLTTHFNSE